jgi:hypothetical protein
MGIFKIPLSQTLRFVQVFGNKRQSQIFSKNDCPNGMGSQVDYVVETGTYFSYDSEADANNQALQDIIKNGQDYANIHGSCGATFWNTQQSRYFTRNNCSPGRTGSSVEYIVNAHTYFSYLSQTDADDQALNDIAANGQAYANIHGNCGLFTTIYETTFNQPIISGAPSGWSPFISFGNVQILSVAGHIELLVDHSGKIGFYLRNPQPVLGKLYKLTLSVEFIAMNGAVLEAQIYGNSPFPIPSTGTYTTEGVLTIVNIISIQLSAFNFSNNGHVKLTYFKLEVL